MTSSIDALTLTCHKITLKNYRAQLSIGILPKEQAVKQPVMINIDVWVKNPERVSDAIDDVYDYRLIVDALRESEELPHVGLQETLIEKIASRILSHEKVKAVRVSSMKTSVLENADGIGVEITRVK